MSYSLQLHGLQHTRPPCPSPTPGVYSDSCPSSQYAIQPSYPLLSPSSPAFKFSQHQGLFQWVSSSHQVAKLLELQLQPQSFQWIFRIQLLFIIKYAAAAKSLQSCPTLCDTIDGSPPGSPVPGILQARTLEWVAISFSNAWKWKVKVKSLSRVWLLGPHGLQPTRLLRPWDFPGKSTGVGWHTLRRS